MISAIILAAGKSTRMGQQKMLMPWGKSTVLATVIQTIHKAGVEDIILVTNSEIASRFSNLDMKILLNTTDGEMLTSLQIGLREQKLSAEATLVCLGDQPQVEERSVQSVCEMFQKTKSNLIVPSYNHRRGHPWLAARPLWDEILAMKSDQSPRDFLNAHANEIEYVELDTPTILQDLDTPQDYLKYKPPL